MDEEREEIGLRMAKSPKEEREAMWTFFQKLEEMVEDPDVTLHEIGEYVADEMDEGLIGGGWRRLLWGFETVLENACDPDKDYLDWKPEYKALVEDNGADNGTGKVLKWIRCDMLSELKINGRPLTYGAIEQLRSLLPGAPVFDGQGRALENYVGQVVRVGGDQVQIEFRRHLPLSSGYGVFLEVMAGTDRSGNVSSIGAVVAADVMAKSL